MSQHASIMQFFGGPLDGHTVFTAPLPPTVVTFETTLVRPTPSVLRRVVRWLMLDFNRNQELTIVATYHLDRRCGRSGYVHTGSHDRKQLQAAVGCERLSANCS